MTKQTVHTPGPWKACAPRFGYQHIRQDPKDWDGHGYQAICTLPQSPKGTHYGEMFKANARLIAAAPDLLAVLEEIIRRNEIQHWFNLDQARAAVARALGEEARAKEKTDAGQ